MTYRSNADAVIRALLDGIDRGLVRAGAVVVDAVKENIRGGYTTGAFVTGANLNSVYATAPATQNGVRGVVVTTRLTDPNYPAFWEEGHVNIFAGPKSGGALASLVGSKREGRYLKVPKWAPALESSSAEAEATFAETVQSAAAAAGAAFLRTTRDVTRGGR